MRVQFFFLSASTFPYFCFGSAAFKEKTILAVAAADAAAAALGVIVIAMGASPPFIASTGFWP